MVRRSYKARVRAVGEWEGMRGGYLWGRERGAGACGWGERGKDKRGLVWFGGWAGGRGHAGPGSLVALLTFPRTAMALTFSIYMRGSSCKL